MTPYDAAMLGVVIAGMVWGAIRGITWQLASMASLALGYLVAKPVSYQISGHFPGDPVVQRALALLSVYAAVSCGVFLAAWTVRTTLRKLRFEAYDRHLGMMLGGAEGAFLGVVATMAAVSLVPSTRGPIFGSPSGRVVSRAMDAVGPMLPPEIRDHVEPFWTHLKSPDATRPEPAGAVADLPEPAADPTPPAADKPPASTVDRALNFLEKEIDGTGDARGTAEAEAAKLRDLAKSRLKEAVRDAIDRQVERSGRAAPRR